MLDLTAEQVIAAMRSHNYAVFDGGAVSRKYDLNLFGVRTDDMAANTFNDSVGVFYKFDGRWHMFMFPATTDPGTYYRERPLNVIGTALLKPGQYRGAYTVGGHKGYAALQQRNPMMVYRDADRNNMLDAREDSVQYGMFGINIHRANVASPSVQVDKWSAGCQVLQDPIHFAFLMGLCSAAAKVWGNSFTYTLLTEADFI